MKDRKTGLYIHIPFCESKCKYCDFLSIPTPHPTLVEKYVNALCKEIEYCGREIFDEVFFDSLFLGGGTPSILSVEQISKIMNAVNNNLSYTRMSEFTIEANPSSITLEKLNKWLELGFDRLSMGIQSFDREILDKIGRIHTPEDARKSFYLAREAGFYNINIDIMFGIPGQTLKQYLDTLKEAINLKPDHISFYQMQLEFDTPMYLDYVKEKIPSLDEELINHMYHKGLEILRKAGYEQYEIANAALPGFECRHNKKYWNLSEFIGLGVGASSFLNGYSFKNYDNVEEYIRVIKENKDISINHELTQKYKIVDAFNVYVMTALRRKQGIEFDELYHLFEDISNFYDLYEDTSFIDRYVSEGLLIVDEEGIRLTDKGIMLSNNIIEDFMLISESRGIYE